jgi:hypothetical protein
LNPFTENQETGPESSGDPFSSANDGGSSPNPSLPASVGPPVAMPKLWIGYLLAFAALVGEGIAFSRNPELMKPSQVQFIIPPLEIFLPLFVARVYWLVCVYQYHKILQAVPGWKHPVSPARAVGFHFIPLFNFVWFFIWPAEIAKFVNARLQHPVMRGWTVGLAFLFAFICQIILDPAIGLVLFFLSTGYLASGLSRALAMPRSAPMP